MVQKKRVTWEKNNKINEMFDGDEQRCIGIRCLRSFWQWFSKTFLSVKTDIFEKILLVLLFSLPYTLPTTFNILYIHISFYKKCSFLEGLSIEMKDSGFVVRYNKDQVYSLAIRIIYLYNKCICMWRHIIPTVCITVRYCSSKRKEIKPKL